MGLCSWLKKKAPQSEPLYTDQSGATYTDRNNKFLINEKVLDLTKHFEGLVLEARDDGYGTVTGGYGRIKYPDGSKVRVGDKFTEASATSALLWDLYEEGAKYVRAYLKDTMEDNLSPDEFSVYTDLTFNRGAGRFREYIAPHLNLGNKRAAMDALVRLNTVAGVYNLGLDRRRWAERFVLEGRDWRAFMDLGAFLSFKSRGYK